MQFFKNLFNNRQSQPPTFNPIWLGQDGSFRNHHPIFDEFTPFTGTVPLNFDVDYVGSRTRQEFLSNKVFRDSKQFKASIPPIDEEYFEWIDILLSVKDAGKNYTMLELGAGYGRWAARAALAARQRNLQVQVGLVEAEPAHIQWISTHLNDNDIKTEEYKIFESAVSDTNGSIMFYIGMPDDFDESTPKNWYGQAITKDYEALKEQTDEQYYGYPVLELASGWKAVQVKTKNICEILSNYSKIDLLDLDVQGEELKILTAAKDQLDKKVKRIHIGTHDIELENGLRDLFKGKKWHLLRDYSCNRKNSTPFGEIEFVDGVQTWVNTRYDVSIA